MNPGATVSTRRPFAKSASAALLARWTTRERAIASAAVIGVAAVALRVAFAPQLDILDDAGYLEAARRVSIGQPLDNLFPLFRLRVGMAYPLGWLMSLHVVDPTQFWLLTIAADLVALLSLFAAGWLLTGLAEVGLASAAVYAGYPLAIQQSAMYYPTSFQVASIALACALIALAERSSGSRRWLSAAGAGVSLGVGYLFKEDVAIVVVMMAIASLIARFPRVPTMTAVCAGAAAVFGAECAAYWQTTGNPLFRITATSGLGAPIGDNLQIAEIWRWDAYLRSLWLLPVQVGVTWWLAIPAIGFAWRSRRSARGLAFVAVLFAIVMLYLQFGSGSFSQYSPLPKTPRYTALATPLLMLLLGAWLAHQATAHRRRALLIATAIVLTAVPCLLYLLVSSGERTRNTLAVAPVMQTLGPGDLHTDYYSARVLRLIAPDREIRTWYHAKFDEARMNVVAPPAAGAYALLDRQAAKVYTSSYELPLPPDVDRIPAGATIVWTHQAYEPGSISRRILELMRDASRFVPADGLRTKVTRSVNAMIEGDDAVLYRVPPSK